MPDTLHYPGKHRILEIADNGLLTCWFGAVGVVGLSNLCFLPLSGIQGPSLAHAYPLLVPWTIAAMVILGAIPGHLFRRKLLQTRVDDWLVRGPIETRLPMAAEHAIGPAMSIWLVGLPAVILAHHYVIHGGNGAWVTRLWIKIVIAIVVPALMRAALAQRVHYELAGR